MNRPLDWIFLSLYFVVITGLGIFLGRRNKDFASFMFGNNKVPWIAVGISLIATSISATTFLGNPEDAYKNNMTYLMTGIGGLLSLWVIGKLFIPKIMELKVKSAYELLELRFSRSVRLLASTLYCLHLLLRTGILIYGPALVLANMFGFNIYMAIILMSLFAIAYTWFGGIQAVIWTDVLQFIVLFGGGIFILWFLSAKAGGFAELWQSASEAGKLKVFDFSLDPKNPRTLLSAGIIYTVFEIAIRGCDQQFVQRYLSCKNPMEANRSSVLSVLLGIAVGFVFYLIGAGLYVYFQNIKPGLLEEGISSADVFPYFIINMLPPGITGLMVAAIMAAAMSSLDSAMTALSNTAVVDFKWIFGKHETEEKGQLASAKWWTLIFGALGVIAAIICAQGEKSLLSKALFFTSLFTGPLLAMFIAAFFKPHWRASSLWWGSGAGVLCLLLFSNIPILPEGVWEPLYRFSWPWNPLISLCASLTTMQIIEAIRPLKPLTNK